MILTRSTRLSQPQGPVELDRTNPLLRGSGAGVEFCFLPGSNFDPASRNTWAKNSGSDVIRRFGRAVSFAGSVGNAYTQTTNLTSQEKVTLIAVIERDGASPYAGVFATSSSNSAFRIEFAGNGSDLALVKGGVVELPSINIPAGVPHVVVTSHNQLTGEYYIVASPLYGGNKLRAAGTNTQSSIPSDGTLSINRNGGANTLNGSVGLLCGFFDFLSESVAHKILDNPWQLFRPVQRRVYFDMGAGGGGTTHTVTTDPVEQGSTTTRPGLAQTHVTTAMAVAQGATVSRPAVTQTHVVTARAVAQGSAVNAPAVEVGSITVVTARPVVQSSTVNAPSIVQTHVLTARPSAQGGTVTRPGLNQTHTVTARAVTQGSVVNAPSVDVGSTPATVVTARPVAQGSTVNAPGIRQTHVTSARAVVQGSTISAPGLVQAHMVTARPVVQASAVRVAGVAPPFVRSIYWAAVPSETFRAAVPSEKFSAAVPGGNQ